MQRLREVIRGSLARSLRTLPEEDRVAAALPVVCGTALAAHCRVAGLDGERTLHLEVDAPEWLTSLVAMRDHLQHDLQRVAGVPLAGLHFLHVAAAPKGSPRPPSTERTQGPPGRQPAARRSTSASTKGRPA